MNTFFQKTPYFFILIFTISSCEKWDLKKQDFISIEITNLEMLSLNAVKLTGEIRDLEIGQISDHGFIWTSSTNIPTYNNNDGIQSFGILDKEDVSTFSVDLDDFDPSTLYTFVAFALLNDVFYYSEATTWSSGSGMVFTDNIIYEKGRSLELVGHISGTSTGLIGTSYGFCGSDENTIPTLDDNFIDLGVQRSDLPFSAVIEDLEYELPLYFRAFAILRHPTTFELDTVYGEVKFFDGDLKDVWIPRASIPEIGNNFFTWEALGFSNSDDAYFYVGTEFDNFWNYDPIEDLWIQKENFGGQAAGISFSVNNKNYISGGWEIGTGENLTDLWEYDPQTDVWTQKVNYPGEGFNSRMASFSIGDKGYIGLGFAEVNYANDFWEYDPIANEWTQIADFAGEARADAVTFTIGGEGYVGIGTGKPFDFNISLDDFWKYNPQQDTWTQVADFGGESRDGATGFSIGDKGYVGLGFNFESGLLNDFWEYDSNENTWIRLSDLPTTSTQDFSSFTINERGFVGRFDFWEYISR